jgi:hypothetical protein
MHEGKVEYQLSKSWSLEGYGGDAPAAGAAVVWRREY